MLFNDLFLLFSSSAMDDLQMKELQDQLEAEQYFSVSDGNEICGGSNTRFPIGF